MTKMPSANEKYYTSTPQQTTFNSDFQRALFDQGQARPGECRPEEALFWGLSRFLRQQKWDCPLSAIICRMVSF
jgi:hypothetical protein